MSKKTYKDFETKKTIHFNITREAHSRLRIECFKKRVSMQEVFEAFASRVSNESNDVIRIMDQLVKDKQVYAFFRENFLECHQNLVHYNLNTELIFFWD